MPTQNCDYVQRILAADIGLCRELHLFGASVILLVRISQRLSKAPKMDVAVFFMKETLNYTLQINKAE